MTMSEFNDMNGNNWCLHRLSDAKSRSISPENRTGEKGCGGMALPNENWPARNIGVGWKCAPFIEIEPGETAVLADIEDEGLIQSMWITGAVDRGLILRMHWDNQKNSSVEVPLTDFFLYGFAGSFALNNSNWNKGPKYLVNSQLVTVNPNRGLNCFFQMPFKKRALITLENRSSRKKVIYYQINYTLTTLGDDIGYFHSQYRSSKPIAKGEVHTLLDNVNGKGKYIGTALYVGLNRNFFWWGEGEFKFFIDGDTEYPTICGTGLEDYFGGAFNWDIEDAYHTYQTPYMGMPYIWKPDGLYNIQQRYALYRWHVMDPIVFQENLKVTLQCLGWKMSDDGLNNKDFLQREDDYISVSYWYQDMLDQNEKVALPSHDSIMCD